MNVNNLVVNHYHKIQQNQLILFNQNQQDQYYLTDKWQRMVVLWVWMVDVQYGLGSFLKKFVRKVIPNEVAEIAVKAAPFVAPFNPIAAGLMSGIGSFDQTGRIGSSLKSGLTNYGLGQASRGVRWWYGKFTRYVFTKCLEVVKDLELILVILFKTLVELVKCFKINFLQVVEAKWLRDTGVDEIELQKIVDAAADKNLEKSPADLISKLKLVKLL